MRGISHEKNPSRRSYFQNLAQYDSFAKLGSLGNSRESLPKPGLIRRIPAAGCLAISASPNLSLGRAIIGRPLGNRKRRRFFRDLENCGCAAYFVRNN
jgi:hypothetical protein